MAKTEFKDIVSPKPFTDAAEGIDTMITKMTTLSSSLDKLGDSYEKRVKAINVSTKEGIETLLKVEKELVEFSEKKTKQEILSIKLEKDKNKEKKKTIELTDNEIKEKLKLQKVTAQRKKDITAELILEEKSINSKNELKDRIKALTIEADKLDLGSEKLAEFNKEIDELNDLLKNNSDQLSQQRINIGNYKSATDGLTDSFEDQKKALKILEDTYKDAVLQGKKGTKQFEELSEELKEQRKVVKSVADSMDDLEDSAKGASKGFDVVGTSLKALGIGAILAVLSKLGDLFGTSREASLESAKAMANFTETVKVFFAALVNSWEGVKEIFTALTESMKSSFLSIEIGYTNLLLTIAEGKDVFGDYSEEIKTLNSEIATLTKEQIALNESTNTVASGYEKATAAFDDFGKTTNTAIDSQQKYLQLQLDTEIAIERQTRALAGLQERRQILQDISDDDTLGFVRRGLALVKARKEAVRFAKLEEELARTKETLTIEAVKQDLRVSKALNETQLAAIKNGEDLNRVLLQNGIALKVSSENENAFTEAFVERVEKQTEALSFQRDQDEKNRKAYRDDYEQLVDIIEEFAEIQFATNEKILADDTKTQEERTAALISNQKIGEELFKESLKLTIAQGKASIELNRDLTASEKEVAKAKLDAIDVNAILSEQDSVEIAKLIRKIGLGETEEKRLKETFKIKKDQNEALIEQQKSLSESDRENLELQRQIALQEEALSESTGRKSEILEKDNEKLEKLDKDRFELEKQNLQERIDLLTEDSNARLELEQELNDLLLEEKETALDKENELKEKKRKEDEDAAKKAEEERKKLIEDSLTFLSNLSDSLFEKKKNKITEELEASKKLEDEKLELTTAASELQEDSIDFQRKKQLELEQEQQRIIKQQKLAELGLNYVKLVTAYANSGKDNPVALATRDTLISKAFIDSLTSAKDGMDDTGTVSSPLDKDGGRTMLIHNNERIFTKEETTEQNKMGLFTRQHVMDKLNEKARNEEVLIINEQKSILNNTDLSRLISETEGVRKAINNMERDKVDYDVMHGIISREVTKGFKKERTFKRLR